jgi:hypothetical protein
MKKIKGFLVLALAAILSLGCSDSRLTGSSNVDLSTAQSTIESLFKAMQSNDTISFMSMIATQEDFISYYESENNLPDKKNKMTPEEIQNEASKSGILSERKQILKRFALIREKGLADGITDWKETKFKRSTADSRNELRQDDPAVLFSYQDNTGRVRLGNYIIKSKRGWVIGNFGFRYDGGRAFNYERMIPSAFSK